MVKRVQRIYVYRDLNVSRFEQAMMSVVASVARILALGTQFRSPIRAYSTAPVCGNAAFTPKTEWPTPRSHQDTHVRCSGDGVKQGR